MELALSLEKLNFTKLRELWKIASEAEDGQLTDFIGMGHTLWPPAHHLSQEPYFLGVACSGPVLGLRRAAR